MKTKRLVTDAMLIAMYFLLSNYFAVNLGSIRLTLDILPIIVGAALFGPLDGLFIGLIGNFLFQLAGPYGLSITTPLWMLPDGIRGLLTGLFLCRRWGKMKTPKLTMGLLIISLIITTLTTGVMYVDCLVFQYSFAAYAPFVIWRYAASVLVSILIALFLIPLLKAMSRVVKINGGEPQ